MSNQPLATRRLSDDDKLMRQKFYERLTAQSDPMDKLSERLLTLELALPGLYATALKLISGDKATIMLNAALYMTFACWLAALIVTLIAMTPRKWLVDPSILKQDPQKFSEGLGIEDFFSSRLCINGGSSPSPTCCFLSGRSAPSSLLDKPP